MSLIYHSIALLAPNVETENFSQNIFTVISLYLMTITGGLARYLHGITTHSGRHMVVT